MIVPGSRSQSVAAALSTETGRSLATPIYERFPDGEQLAAVPGFEGREAVVVAATVTDRTWVELLQLQDAVREAGAREVTTVLPYMGYGRQDRAFEPGEPVSARAMARAVSTGTDRVVVVTPHERGVMEFFDVPATPVRGARLLADALDGLTDPLFLGPDGDAAGLARRVRDAYGGGVADYFEKTRDHATGEVEITPREAPVGGRDVVLVDDIIATGSTMCGAVEVLRERGAGRITAACVHPLLVGNALTRLRRAGVDRVFGTDTIERSVSEVSVAPALAAAL